LVRLLVDVDDILSSCNDLTRNGESRRRKEKNDVSSAKTTDDADGFAESRRAEKRPAAVIFLHYNRISSFGNKEDSVDGKKCRDFDDFS